MEKKGSKSSLRYENPNKPQRASHLAGSPGIKPGRNRDSISNDSFGDGPQKDSDSPKKKCNPVRKKRSGPVVRP